MRKFTTPLLLKNALDAVVEIACGNFDP